MATNRTKLKSVELKYAARVVLGRAKSTSVNAVDGLELVRVTEDGRDDVYVRGNSVQEGTIIPWDNVASAVRLLEPK
jgi:hypothetical protein